MVTFNPSGRLLVGLFDLTQAGESIDLFSLSEAAGLNLYQTLSELERLNGRGLVDARRLRLTLSGLAVAANLDRRSRAIARAGEARTAQSANRNPPDPGSSGHVVRLLSRAVREQPERAEDQSLTRDLVA